MKRFILIALLFFAIPLTAIAETIPSGMDIGQGAIPCKKYASLSLGKKNDYIIWVQGFFSAFNALDKTTKNIAGTRDFNSIREWLDTFCKANPDQYFGGAVRALIEELYPTRTISADPAAVMSTISHIQ
jgi:hypothetical protein